MRAQWHAALRLVDLGRTNQARDGGIVSETWRETTGRGSRPVSQRLSLFSRVPRFGSKGHVTRARQAATDAEAFRDRPIRDGLLLDLNQISFLSNLYYFKCILPFLFEAWFCLPPWVVREASRGPRSEQVPDSSLQVNIPKGFNLGDDTWFRVSQQCCSGWIWLCLLLFPPGGLMCYSKAGLTHWYVCVKG